MAIQIDGGTDGAAIQSTCESKLHLMQDRKSGMWLHIYSYLYISPHFTNSKERVYFFAIQKIGIAPSGGIPKLAPVGRFWEKLKGIKER